MQYIVSEIGGNMASNIIIYSLLSSILFYLQFKYNSCIIPGFSAAFVCTWALWRMIFLITIILLHVLNYNKNKKEEKQKNKTKSSRKWGCSNMNCC